MMDRLILSRPKITRRVFVTPFRSPRYSNIALIRVTREGLWTTPYTNNVRSPTHVKIFTVCTDNHRKLLLRTTRICHVRKIITKLKILKFSFDQFSTESSFFNPKSTFNCILFAYHVDQNGYN